MGLHVVEKDSGIDAAWEAFVRARPDATVYQHPLWFNALEREYKRKGIRLVCTDERGDMMGLLPILATKGLPFHVGNPLVVGPRLSSLPRTPFSGMVTENDMAAVLLIRKAMEKVKEQGEMRLQIKPLMGQESLAIEGVVRIPWRPSFVVKLPQREGDLRFGNSRNHSRIKWSVNKMIREGVSIREGESEDDLKKWYPLYLKTMRRNGAHVRSYRFIKHVWDLLRPRGMMRLLLAESQNGRKRTLLAGSIFLMFNKTVFYAFNGGLRESRANDLIQWRAIHDACKEGYTSYDLGEVSKSHRSLADFKRKWGSEKKQLFHYYYPSKGIQEVGLDENCLSGMIGRIWPRMPLKLTEWISDWVNYYL